MKPTPFVVAKMTTVSVSWGSAFPGNNQVELSFDLVGGMNP